MERRQSAHAIPRLHTIHQGTVKSIQPYGAFIGIEGYKDALLHISRIACSRIEKVEDVLEKNDKVFVKITEVDEDAAKVGCDMRFVGQKKGDDKDPNNVLLAQQDRGKKGGGKGKPENIQLEAVLNTTCTKCGGHGHYAKECWNVSGSKYALLDENDEKEHEIPRSRGPVTRGLEAVQPAWKTQLCAKDLEKDAKRARKEAKKVAKKKKKKKKDKKVKKKLKKKKDAKKKKKKKKNEDSSSSSSSSSSDNVSDADL